MCQTLLKQKDHLSLRAGRGGRWGGRLSMEPRATTTSAAQQQLAASSRQAASPTLYQPSLSLCLPYSVSLLPRCRVRRARPRAAAMLIVAAGLVLWDCRVCACVYTCAYRVTRPFARASVCIFVSGCDGKSTLPGSM